MISSWLNEKVEENVVYSTSFEASTINSNDEQHGQREEEKDDESMEVYLYP